MTKLTTEALAEIEARANAATPKKWVVDPIFDFAFGPAVGECFGKSNRRAQRNAVFCAHARSDIPALLAHIKMLEASPPIPEGWLLVPVEPTEEMCAAALNTGLPMAGEPPLYEKIWRAMLAASSPAVGNGKPKP